MKAVASAPGKVILFGEHFVVYGRLAVVMAIDLRVKVTASERKDDAISITSDLGISGAFRRGNYLPARGEMDGRRALEPMKLASEAVMERLGVRCGIDLLVESQIPVGVGLGSSAASAVATVAATARLLGASLTISDLASLPQRSEEFVHVRPSGVDQTVSAYGGVLSYRRSIGVEQLKIEVEIPIVIGNTLSARSTGRLVTVVRERRERFPHLLDSIIDAGDMISTDALEALGRGDLERVGELMDINQGLLSSVGVSTERLEALIFTSRNAGALGAKLTGAGGGGCMIALSRAGEESQVAGAIRNAGGTAIVASKTERGVESSEI